jgi:hypothetical protein
VKDIECIPTRVAPSCCRLNKNKENEHYILIGFQEKEIPVSEISSFKLKYKFNFLCTPEADRHFASQEV